MRNAKIMMQAWRVTLNGEDIDMVFFDNRCDSDYVKLALINHDDYDSNIIVVKVRTKNEQYSSRLCG